MSRSHHHGCYCQVREADTMRIDARELGDPLEALREVAAMERLDAEDFRAQSMIEAVIDPDDEVIDDDVDLHLDCEQCNGWSSFDFDDTTDTTDTTDNPEETL